MAGMQVSVEHRPDLPGGLPAIWEHVGETVRLFLRDDLSAALVRHFHDMCLSDLGVHVGAVLAELQPLGDAPQRGAGPVGRDVHIALAGHDRAVPEDGDDRGLVGASL